MLILPVLAANGSALLTEARAKDAALRKDQQKLRYRDNILKVIRAWQRASQVTQGQEKIRALQGEAKAWALLAHWSGRGDDQARAKALQAKIARLQKRTPRPTWLTSIAVENTSTGAVLRFDANGPFSLKKRAIKTRDLQGRIFVDLQPVVASQKALGLVKVDHPAITQARMGQFDKDTARLVLDFKQSKDALERVVLEDDVVRLRLGSSGQVARIKSALEEIVPSKRGQPDELRTMLSEIVEDVRKAYPNEGNEEPAKPATQPAKKPAKKKVSKPEPKSKPKPTPNRKAKAEALPPLPKAKLKRSTREAAKSRAERLLAIRTIVIDAGHGGKDRGASKGGVREKDVNLAIAKKLGRVLKRRLGVRIVYTRTRDRFVSLQKRARIANKSRGDLFISVHSNANRDRRVHGIETYYLNTTSDRYSRRLAGRENGTQAYAEPDVLPKGGMGRDLRLILADLAMRSATVESRRLAGYVQTSAVARLRKRYSDVKDLGVKSALFYVLLGVRMPSVLIETGFVSHRREGRRLSDGKYQARMAEAIAAGVERFVKERALIARRVSLMPGDGGVAEQYARAAH